MSADGLFAGSTKTPCLTVAELLSLSEMSEAKLLAGTEASRRRCVRSTSVQSVVAECGDWIRAGDLVLTIGLGLDTGEEQIEQALRALIDARAACLGVSIGPHLREIPEQVIRVAEALHLPLVELPWKLRYSDITVLVFRELLSRQQRLLSRQEESLRASERVHEMFTDIILGRGHLPEVCRALAELLDRHVSVVDRWGEQQASSAEPSASLGDRTGRRTIRYPVGTPALDLGALCIAESDTPLTPLDQRTVQHGAAAAALIMMRDDAVAEAEAHGERELLAGILSGLVRAPEDIERQCRAVGINPRTPFSAAWLLFEAVAEDPRPADDLNRVIEIARRVLDRTFGVRKMQVLRAWFGPEVLLVMPTSSIPIRQQVADVLANTMDLLRGQPLSIVTTAGVADVSGPLSEVTRAAREAAIACRLGRSLGSAGSVTCHGDLGALPALLDVTAGRDATRAVRDLVKRYLGPIVDHQAHARMQLVETLAVLFANNTNLSETARSLGIHRQTLKYRIAKIESLAGVDLSSSSARFALELAVRAYQLRLVADMELPFEVRD